MRLYVPGAVHSKLVVSAASLTRLSDLCLHVCVRHSNDEVLFGAVAQLRASCLDRHDVTYIYIPINKKKHIKRPPSSCLDRVFI